MAEIPIQRIFLIVLDSLGIGEAPDAADFGDTGSNTFRSISRSPAFRADTLRELGICNIDGVDGPRVDTPRAAVARMTERSRGKDTTIGHWEIAGMVSEKPLPTYPDGFPPDVMAAFERATGRGTLCNRPCSGTQVIADYGEEHLRTGKLIVYTSADSVFQVAAHEDVVPPEELYRYCMQAREILQGEHGVGRVIARPFTGEYPFRRTSRRHDFSLLPPQPTMLDLVSEAGLDVLSVGKISDIFAARGVTTSYRTASNAEGMERTKALQKETFHGLCFVNLVDFDMIYGHRNDVDGYAAALAAFDGWLPSFLRDMRKEDVLLITADHGCDPATPSTDHSREYTPLLVVGDAIRPVNLGTRGSFADIAATVCDWLGVPSPPAGLSFAKEVTKL